MKRILVLLACVATLAACGSDSSLPTPTGKGSVRMINAIPGSPPVRFLIEERFLASVDYKSSSSPAPYDDFSYRFNFEIAEPGQSVPTRIGSRTITVEKDREHIFVLTGNVSSPDIAVWDGDIREFSDTDTVLEARFSHASATLGDIDVYFDPVGTVLGTNPPAATLAFGEITDPADFEAGELVLTVTAANDVNTVYFTARESDLLPGFAHIITVVDGDANDTGTVAVRSMTSAGNPFVFPDTTNPPRVRFVNTSRELGALDIYDDDQLTNLIAANVPFGGGTAYMDSTTDATTYYFTPAGSTAQILFEQQIPALSAGTFSQVFVVGVAASPLAVRLVPDRAPFTTSAKLNIFHGATNNTFFDAYLVDRGTELTDDIGAIMLAVGFSGQSPVVELLEGSYDLYLTTSLTRDIISPAYPIDLTNGTVTDLIAVDTVDPAIIDLLDNTN